MKALSLRQPWAYLVCAGIKPVENRTWRTRWRGPVAVHAAWQPDEVYIHRFADLLAGLDLPDDLPRGGIVGVVSIVDCVERCDSPWFCGRVGFVLASPRALPRIECRGLPGLFTLPDEVAARVVAALEE